MPTARDDTQFVYLLARRFATRDPVVRATPEFTKALHHCQSIWGCGYESKKMRPDCGTLAVICWPPQPQTFLFLPICSILRDF